jgi:hypothetical protein
VAVCARDCTAAVTSSIPIEAATTQKLRAERGAWITSSLHIAGLGAVVIFPSPMLFNERKRVIDLAIEHRLATMAMSKEFVEQGGLASYGADITTSIRSAAI